MKKKNNSKCNGWLVRNRNDLIPLGRAGWQADRWAEPWFLHWASLLFSPACAREEIGLQKSDQYRVTWCNWCLEKELQSKKEASLAQSDQLEQGLDQGASRIPSNQGILWHWDLLRDVCKWLLYPTWSSDVFKHRSFCLGNSAFSLQDWVFWLLTKLLPKWHGDCFQKVSLLGNHRWAP